MCSGYHERQQSCEGSLNSDVAAVIRRVGNPEPATFNRLIKGRNGANLPLAMPGATG
jgi:hypothetical protein